MTAFTDLIADFQAEKRFLLVLKPYDVAGAALTTLYYSSHGFTSEPSDTPANQHYESRIKSVIEFTRSVYSQGRLSGRSIPGYGKIVLNNEDGGLDVLATYAWGGRQAQLYMGGPNFALSDYGLIADVICGPLEYGDGEIIVPLHDLQALFDKEIQTTLFAGTGGAEGGADVAGKKKPLLCGVRRHFEPIYLGKDTGNHMYAFSSGASVGLLEVRENGLAWTFTSGAPGAAQYTCDLTNSTITLGSTPIGRITCAAVGKRYLSTTSTTSWTVGNGSKTFTVASATGLEVGMQMRVARTAALNATYGDGKITGISGSDVTINITSNSGAAGPHTDWTVMAWGTVAGILKSIATDLGISSFKTASFTALDNAQPAMVGYWIPDGGNALGHLDNISNGAGCYYGFDRSKQFDVGRIAAPTSSVETYDSTQILDGYPQRVSTEEPNYRFDVKYRKNDAVLSEEQIAAAVSDSDRAFLTAEWRHAVDDDAAILTAYPQSKAIEIDSIFDESSAADAEATRQLGLFGARRDYFHVLMKAQPLARDLAETVTIKHARYGLSAGKDGLIVDIVEDMTDYEAQLGLWC